MPNEKKKKRPFTIIYNDTFLKLSTVYEKAMYMALKMHVNAKGQCFPSVGTLAEECGMGIVKASAVLKELEKKGIIKKENQYLQNGGKTSNLYTICDKLVIESPKQKSKPQEPQESKKTNVIPDDMPEFNFLTNSDQRKEASQVNQADQSNFTQDTSEIDISDLQLHDNTKDEASQAENRTEKVAVQTKHSTDELKKQYDYVAMIYENPSKQEYIDICMDIISTTINSKKKNIRIQKEEIPKEKVTDKLLKLTKDDILWAIGKYEQQPTTVHYPKAYLLTLLYDAHNQRVLDLQNKKSVAAAAAAPPKAQQKAVASGTQVFQNFTGRQNNNYMDKVMGQYNNPYGDEDLKALEDEVAALKSNEK